MTLPTSLEDLDVLPQHTLPPPKRLRQEVPLGQRAIKGAMLESHLFEGNQTFTRAQDLRYSVSITDACMGCGHSREPACGSGFVTPDSALR